MKGFLKSSKPHLEKYTMVENFYYGNTLLPLIKQVNLIYFLIFAQMRQRSEVHNKYNNGQNTGLSSHKISAIERYDN